MSWFAPLFILYVVLIVGYHIAKAARIEAAERKARQERERIAAERKEKAEAKKREQAAARAARAAEVAAQPPRKRGRPRKNPPAELPKESKPAAPVPAEQPAPVPVEPQPVNNAPKTGAFAGEVVAFTGTCPKMERRHMISHVNRLGGHGYETINTRCTLLVVAEKPGKNQLDKAAKWNVPTITWEEWWLRTFNYPAIVKPKPAEDAPVSLDQFANMIHNAA